MMALFHTVFYKPAKFGVHAMEHELSAFYDITHGMGLAILEPRWMRQITEKAIEKTEDWFLWGMP
mgnify:CR=1 FL=1